MSESEFPHFQIGPFSPTLPPQEQPWKSLIDSEEALERLAPETVLVRDEAAEKRDPADPPDPRLVRILSDIRAYQRGDLRHMDLGSLQVRALTMVKETIFSQATRTTANQVLKLLDVQPQGFLNYFLAGLPEPGAIIAQESTQSLAADRIEVLREWPLQGNSPLRPKPLHHSYLESAEALTKGYQNLVFGKESQGLTDLQRSALLISQQQCVTRVRFFAAELSRAGYDRLDIAAVVRIMTASPGSVSFDYEAY